LGKENDKCTVEFWVFLYYLGAMCKIYQEQFKKVKLKELGVGFVEMFWVYEINK